MSLPVDLIDSSSSPDRLRGNEYSVPRALPSCTSVHALATAFSLHHTLIHTPFGPAYQLSSPLDQPASRLCIRQLLPEELHALRHSMRESEVAFRKTEVLYQVHDPPFLSHEFYLHPSRRAGTSLSVARKTGILQLRLGLTRWHVSLVGHEGSAANGTDLLTCGKRSSISLAFRDRRNERQISEWKDRSGCVVAREAVKLGGLGMGEGARRWDLSRHGERKDAMEMIPTIEMCEELDQSQSEALVMIWIAKLWAATAKRRQVKSER